MKPLLKLINSKNSIFQIMNVREPCFFPHWHFHPEFEIMLVIEGSGMRFVGDSMERFDSGDLVFYGSNIPHLYRSDEEYYQTEGRFSTAKVVYFNEDLLGEGFIGLSDLLPIRKLMSQAKRGIKFKGKVKHELIQRIKKLDDQKNGIEKIIDLLIIFKIMAYTDEKTLLSSPAFVHHMEEDDCKRINNVYQHVIDHYAENPSLDEVADVANMSPTAFCRYFKIHTNKTYIQFLNEIKIGYACRMLIDDKFNISQISLEVGFNNFTHFNNQFKKHIGLTPKQYRNKHSFLGREEVPV